MAYSLNKVNDLKQHEKLIKINQIFNLSCDKKQSKLKSDKPLYFECGLGKTGGPSRTEGWGLISS